PDGGAGGHVERAAQHAVVAAAHCLDEHVAHAAAGPRDTDAVAVLDRAHRPDSRGGNWVGEGSGAALGGSGGASGLFLSAKALSCSSVASSGGTLSFLPRRASSEATNSVSDGSSSASCRWSAPSLKNTDTRRFTGSSPLRLSVNT